MGQVLDSLAQSPASVFEDEDEILAIVRRNVAAAEDLPQPITLERGIASIPLKGIDVPFHSSHLHAEIDPYRRYLETKIRQEDIDADKLIGKFIPNVMAKPFSVDMDYVEQAARVTNSSHLWRLHEEVRKCMTTLMRGVYA